MTEAPRKQNLGGEASTNCNSTLRVWNLRTRHEIHQIRIKYGKYLVDDFNYEDHFVQYEIVEI